MDRRTGSWHLRWRGREAIKRINRYTNGMVETDFLANQLTQDAVIRNLEVIGEARKNIDRNCPEFVAEHPELPLSSAYEMQNALAHGYFKVDLKIVWKTIGSDLPDLLWRVGDLIQESGS